MLILSTPPENPKKMEASKKEGFFWRLVSSFFLELLKKINSPQAASKTMLYSQNEKNGEENDGQ